LKIPFFARERDLVRSFKSVLESSDSPWTDVRVSAEFDYSRGKTDLVALASDGAVLAFEAKLEKWREALDQAYRNTCYAHESFVLLPEDVANRASRHRGEFLRRAVGLCALTEEGVKILIPAVRNEAPIQQWLSEEATRYACSAR